MSMGRLFTYNGIKEGTGDDIMYQTISMKQLEEELDCGRDMMLLDVRDRPYFCTGHLRGAVNIPYEELERKFACLPKDKTIVCYCTRGALSMLACNYLSPKGYRVINTANGLSGYRGKYLVNDRK